MNLRVTEQAKHDIREARDWLAERSPDLPLRFRAALDQAFASILEHPEIYPVIHRRFRRALTKTFPWAVFYTVEGEAVVVHGVIHQSRHPRAWKRRA